MARDTRRLFEIELRKFEPTVRRAFQSAIRDIKNNVQLRQLERALERGDIQAALNLLNLGNEFYAPFDQAVRNAFAGGAAYQINTLPKVNPATGQRLVIRFQGNHERAEQVLRTLSGQLITNIIDPQREAIRSILAEKLAQGANPRTTALDIVGRVNRRTGRREGGIIGLTERDARAVENLRFRLLSEGVNNPEPRVTKKYNQLLKARGERIARTETIAALNEGRTEALNQLIDRGEIRADQVTRIWDATGDLRTRPQHAAIDGQSKGFNQPFVMPDGSLLNHPGDTSLGAPASQVVNCRCYVSNKIDFLAGLT